MQELLKECPVCSGSDFSSFLEGKDYFLSRECFSIQSCNHCGFKFTNPRPDFDHASKYYETEKYISHNAKDGGLIAAVYRIARFFAIRKKFSIIQSLSPGRRLLDVGCGTAELLNYCRKNGMDVKGVEPNARARDFAKQNYSIEVFQKLNDLKEEERKFDCISLWHVLEHLPSLAQSLKDIDDLLQPMGVLIIAVPNAESWDAGHYGKFWAAYDLPRHLYHFSESSLRRLLENHSFEIVEKIPQKLDAYYISLLSEQYKSGSRNLVKATINGLRSNFNACKRKHGYSSIIFAIRRKKA